jgi:hypothetical protein
MKRLENLNACLYRSMTGLIHPAVCGTILVYFVDALLTGKVSQGGWFAWIASAALAWYIVLDYWVTLVSYEGTEGAYGPDDYPPAAFLVDLVILVGFFWAYRSLWVTHSDVGFFSSVAVVAALFIAWSAFPDRDEFSFKDPYTVGQTVLCVTAGLAALLTGVCAPGTTALAARSAELVVILVLLSIYTVGTLSED